MYLWIQRIILIPFVAFCGIFFVAVFSRFVLPNFIVMTDKMDGYARLIAWLVAGIAVLVYVLSWKRVGKNSERPAAQKAATSLGPKLLWALVILIGAPFLYSIVKSQGKNAERGLQPGFAAFQAANTLIVSSRHGVVHGNTPDAKELALAFSSGLAQARKLGIESRRSAPVVSLTGGEFLTYCLLQDESCVFMVHVPELRKYTSEAKDFIADAAWSVAMTIAESHKANLKNVTVGLRGVMLYDRVISCRLNSTENTGALHPANISGDTECQSFLQPYFAKITPSSVTAP